MYQAPSNKANSQYNDSPYTRSTNVINNEQLILNSNVGEQLAFVRLLFIVSNNL